MWRCAHQKRLECAGRHDARGAGRAGRQSQALVVDLQKGIEQRHRGALARVAVGCGHVVASRGAHSGAQPQLQLLLALGHRTLIAVAEPQLGRELGVGAWHAATTVQLVELGVSVAGDPGRAGGLVVHMHMVHVVVVVDKLHRRDRGLHHADRACDRRSCAGGRIVPTIFKRDVANSSHTERLCGSAPPTRCSDQPPIHAPRVYSRRGVIRMQPVSWTNARSAAPISLADAH